MQYKSLPSVLYIHLYIYKFIYIKSFCSVIHIEDHKTKQSDFSLDLFTEEEKKDEEIVCRIYTNLLVYMCGMNFVAWFYFFLYVWYITDCYLSLSLSPYF